MRVVDPSPPDAIVDLPKRVKMSTIGAFIVWYSSGAFIVWYSSNNNELASHWNVSMTLNEQLTASSLFDS